jgi:hypothetical protein
VGLARYVVDAVVIEGRSVREVARSQGVSTSWLLSLSPATAKVATKP